MIPLRIPAAALQALLYSAAAKVRGTALPAPGAGGSRLCARQTAALTVTALAAPSEVWSPHCGHPDTVYTPALAGPGVVGPAPDVRRSQAA